jgi:hypothetical protein
MTKLSFIDHRLRPATLPGLLAVMFSLSAHAVPYQYTFNSDTGLIPAQGNLTFEHLISIPPSSIQSVEIALTFANSDLLDGTISGSLTLSTAAASPGPYLAFTPTGANSGNVYDATFQGSPFQGLNPNGYWDLNLLNSNPLFENELVGWTLDLTVAPTSVNDGGDTLLLLSLVFPALLFLKRRRATEAMSVPSVSASASFETVKP